MPYETLLYEKRDGVAIVVVNRPDKLNALNQTVMKDLGACFAAIRDDDHVRAVILTGAGEKAFVAGADINELAVQTPVEGKETSLGGQGILDAIENLGKPVIAAVNGYALGGGCELAMACQLRIASENAKFGQPEVKLGIIPGYGGTQRLTQLIGKGKALELLMTADTIDAACAEKLRLVNDVVQTVELLDVCKALINKITSMAPFAIAQVIQSVYAHFKDGIDGFDTETELFGKCVATHDFVEGTSAFLEKRKANFKGE